MVFWDLVLANISTLYYLVQAFNRRENKIGIRALLFRKEIETAAPTVCCQNENCRGDKKGKFTLLKQSFIMSSSRGAPTVLEMAELPLLKNNQEKQMNKEKSRKKSYQTYKKIKRNLFAINPGEGQENSFLKSPLCSFLEGLFSFSFWRGGLFMQIILE